jgi:hypothetical protein
VTEPEPWTPPAAGTPLLDPFPVAEPGPLRLTGLRVSGRPRACRTSCGASVASLVFTSSHAGTVPLVAERRACRRGRCRYLTAGRVTITVSAGPQRLALGTRLAGAVRLRTGTWRVTLAGAKVTFRVR